MDTATKEARKTARRLANLRAKVENLVDDAETYEGYSGRGMFGAKSPYAFTTGLRPHAEEGKKLLKLGFRVDSLGRDFVYYLHA